MTDFPHKLDEWVEEEIDVPVHEGKFDTKGNFIGMEQSTTKKTVKTMYSRVETTKMSCATGTHHWIMRDKKKHIASCTECPKNRYLRAIYEQIIDGHIVERETRQLID